MVTAGGAVDSRQSVVPGDTACPQTLRYRRHVGLVAVIICWPLALSGCDLFRITEPPSDPPKITGVIMTVDLNPPLGQGLRQLLIDEDPSDPTPWNRRRCRSAYFQVDNAAILVRQPDGSWQRGRKQHLSVGDVAEGWYKKGSLALSSCPGQGEASVIAILEPAQ